MKLFLATTILLAAVVAPAAADWSRCGVSDDHVLHTQTVVASPKHDDSVVIHVSGTVNDMEALANATWHVKLHKEGSTRAIVTASGSLMEVFRSMPAAGYQTKNSESMFSIAPTIALPTALRGDHAVSATLRVHDANGKVQACVRVKKVAAAPLPLVGASDETGWQACNTSYAALKPLSFSVSPQTILPGDVITVSIKVRALSAITGGTIKIVAHYDGVIQIAKASYDLCGDLSKLNVTCPVQPQLLSLTDSFHIPFVLTGNYSANAQIYDKTGTELMCVDAWIMLT